MDLERRLQLKGQDGSDFCNPGPCHPSNPCFPAGPQPDVRSPWPGPAGPRTAPRRRIGLTSVRWKAE
jgi:hypothetical protein